MTLGLEAPVWEGLEDLEALMITVLHQVCEGFQKVIKINNDIVQ